MTKHEIKRRFVEHCPFPEGLGGEEINGIEVVMVDTYSAGLIHAYLHSKTGLDQSQYELLLEIWNDLNKIIDDIPAHGKHTSKRGMR
jgi:hypothetical protein